MSLKTATVLGFVTIVSTFLFPSAAQAAISPGARDALIALYSSTGGDNRPTNTNWQKPPGVFNDAGTECTWFGVTCDAGETTVSRLILTNNQLTGAIPPELSQLANLQEGGLELRSNHLYTDDNSLRAFLNSRQDGGDWESFQTLYRYFAQFGDGGGLSSQLVLFSLNDVAVATGQVEILGNSGGPLTVDLNGQTVVGTRSVSVPATGLLSLRTDGLGDVQTGSVRVRTTRHVEGVVIFGGGIGLAGVGSSPEYPSGFVAPIQRNAGPGGDRS